MTERSILLFENAVRSKITLFNYKNDLGRFLKFTKIRDFDSLALMPSNQLQTLIEDYVMHLKKTVSPNSVSAMMAGVKLFFIMNRVILNWEIIKKMYPEKIKTQGFKSWQTADIKKMIDSTSSLRSKAIIHFIASTGCRLGAFDNLKMKHLEDMGEGCKSILIYSGSKEEYYSFLTPEASQALDSYFEERLNDKERFDEETPLFRTMYQLGIQKVQPLSVGAVKNLIYRIINSNNTIKRNKVFKNYDIQIDHGFRKRFNTILKLENSVNANIAEKIMGHKNGLDGVYLTPTKEQCFNEFKKAILNLTISDEERQKVEIIKQQEEISELRAKEIEIENLKEEFKKDHEIVEQLNWVGEFFQYYINKARGNTSQEDDKKFNEKYDKFVKPIPKEESELTLDPEIKRMLDEMTVQMMGSQKVS